MTVDADAYWKQRTLDVLGRLDEIESRMDRLRPGVEPLSAAEREMLGKVGHYAWSYAVTGVQVSYDHLRAFRFLTSQAPQLPFAHWTLLRASIEGSALSLWVCRTSPELRVARGVGIQQADFEQRQGFEERMRKAMPKAKPPKVSAVLRRTELRKEAREAGVEPAGFPGPTSLIARTVSPAKLGDVVVDAEVLYRVLSSAAHSRMWGLPILTNAARGKRLSAAPELIETSFTAPLDVVWLVTDWAVRVLNDAVTALEAYATAESPR